MQSMLKDIWPQISVVINKEITCCTLCVTLFETVWTSNDTAWPFNTGQGNTKRPIGTSKWWPRPLNGHDCLIGQNYSIEGNIFWDFENWQLNRGWTPITGCKKNTSNVISTEKTFYLILAF